MGALRNKADSLCNSLLLLSNGLYVYQHPSLMEAVILDFGQRYPSETLSSCSVHFLLERIFTRKSAPPDNEFVVILQPIMFPQMCARLTKEIARCVVDQKDGMRSLASYAVFKDDTFTQEFLLHLRDTASFYHFLTSSSPHTSHRTFLFIAAASGQGVLFHEVLSSHLRDMQRLQGFINHLDRVLYAACYSGSPVAVRALLAIRARSDLQRL